MKKSIRFSSEKAARGFAAKVNGEFKDLRGHEQRKSDFKVTFEKKPYDPYGDWYNEASMDGSLAYNGVTDDF